MFIIINRDISTKVFRYTKIALSKSKPDVKVIVHLPVRKKELKIALFSRNSDYFCIFLLGVIIKVNNKTISSFQ